MEQIELLFKPSTQRELLLTRIRRLDLYAKILEDHAMEYRLTRGIQLLGGEEMEDLTDMGEIEFMNWLGY